MDNQNNQNIIMNNTNLISTQLIQNLVDNYRTNQLEVINENLNMEDAHSIWFDLPTLKTFISEIETQAQLIDQTVKDSDLGIRFYYAAYPEVPEMSVPANYANRHTLVMVPTKKKDNLDYDFNPLEDTNGALAITGLITDALAMNHGTLVPPKTSIVESY
ncbi:hypothetical protein AB4Y90_00095 [Chryseobacterium sp. 2TAF14]|uniref:hypothetical protein n=1 Tax=Chryseobacterium sp. 2TAF14 TaxID=3233007 RepID=UPI003F91BF3E